MWEAKIISISFIVFTLFLFTTCYSAQKAQSVPNVSVAEVAPVARANWEQKWDSILSEAKRERQVVVWGTDATWAGSRPVIVEAFKSELPCAKSTGRHGNS